MFYSNEVKSTPLSRRMMTEAKSVIEVVQSVEGESMSVDKAYQYVEAILDKYGRPYALNKSEDGFLFSLKGNCVGIMPLSQDGFGSLSGVGILFGEPQ